MEKEEEGKTEGAENNLSVPAVAPIKNEKDGSPLYDFLKGKLSDEDLNEALKLVEEKDPLNEVKEQEEQPVVKDAGLPFSEPEKKPEAKPSEKAMAMDAMSRQIMASIAKKDNLVKAVTPFVGTFDSALMTDKDVAVYACKKLGINAEKGKEDSFLSGYLAAATKNKQPSVTFGLDSAGVLPNAQDPALSAYLKGSK